MNAGIPAQKERQIFSLSSKGDVVRIEFDMVEIAKMQAHCQMATMLNSDHVKTWVDKILKREHT